MSRKKAPEQVVGSYLALPHSVLDSVAYRGASHPAKALLVDLARQLNGRNNGHLQLSTNWLRKRGWTSNDVIQRAKGELINRNLAIKTRLGGLNAGPDLWAVTWLPISDFSGLSEVSKSTYHPGNWHSLDRLNSVPSKRDAGTVCRTSAAPLSGTVSGVAVPSHGAKLTLFDPVTVPASGNNVVTSSLSGSATRRIVGKRRLAPTAAALLDNLRLPVGNDEPSRWDQTALPAGRF